MGRWRLKALRPRIVELIKKGVTTKAICLRLNIRREYIYDIAKEEGLTIAKENTWDVCKNLNARRKEMRKEESL